MIVRKLLVFSLFALCAPLQSSNNTYSYLVLSAALGCAGGILWHSIKTQTTRNLLKEKECLINGLYEDLDNINQKYKALQRQLDQAQTELRRQTEIHPSPTPQEPLTLAHETTEIRALRINITGLKNIIDILVLDVKGMERKINALHAHILAPRTTETEHADNTPSQQLPPPYTDTTSVTAPNQITQMIPALAILEQLPSQRQRRFLGIPLPGTRRSSNRS